MPEIPLAPIDRIIHKAGAERVSNNAALVLRDVLEAIAYEIAKEAIELAKHAGRRTVTEEDVKLAARRLTKWLLPTL
ncbi:MAG: histone [Thermoprotei archaeon]|nr:MAG: histone [Thermoprotei archaeon]RLE96990.1 MAG: histone [Thermoprotei archaeon]